MFSLHLPSFIIILLTTTAALAQIPPQYTTNFSPPDSASAAAGLEVSFVNHTVQDGEALPPSLCKSAPTPRLYHAPLPPLPSSGSHGDDGEDIIIICIDPDSHRPLEVAHWVHSGWRPRRSNNGTSALETHVEAEFAYIPPTPPPRDGMGWHRYIFLAFARRNSSRKIIGIPGGNKVDGGVIWNTTEWRLKNGLDMPFAGTYFKADNVASQTNVSEGKEDIRMPAMPPLSNVSITYIDPSPRPSIQPSSSSRSLVVFTGWTWAVLTGFAVVMLASCFGM